MIYSNYLTFTGHTLDQVISAMAQATKLAPNVPQYQINLAKAYIMIGDFAAAEASIAELSRLNKFGNLDYNIAQLSQRLAAAREAVDKPERRPPPQG